MNSEEQTSLGEEGQSSHKTRVSTAFYGQRRNILSEAEAVKPISNRWPSPAEWYSEGNVGESEV